jgi:hypothetical protein
MQVIAQAPASASITGTTGGVFNVIAGEPGAGIQNNLNAPGTARLNGQPFRVRLAGLVVLAAGTYTATVQPLLYSSTYSATSPFTAATAAQAIYSAAAISVTQASASAKNVPFSVEAYIEGDSTSGLVVASILGLVNNGAVQGATAPVAGVNLPTSINFSTEPPLQFAAGVTLSNAGTGTVSSLSAFQLEA